MSAEDAGFTIDPAVIVKGLRDGSIRLTPADDEARTPVVRAYLRQVAAILADHFEQQAAKHRGDCAGD